MAPASLGIVLMLPLRVEDVRVLRRTMRDPNEELIFFGAWNGNLADLQFGGLRYELADMDRLHFGEVKLFYSFTYVRC